MSGVGSAKGRGANHHNKLEIHHEKFMKSIGSLLSMELAFILPAIAWISKLDKLSEENLARLLLSIVIVGDVSFVALVLSHSTVQRRYVVVSAMTLVVTIFWLGIFYCYGIRSV